jgi:hypothetical protein
VAELGVISHRIDSTKAKKLRVPTRDTLLARPSEQSVQNEVENQKLFTNLVPESLIDCVLGPSNRRRVPVRAVVDNNDWHSTQDIVRPEGLSSRFADSLNYEYDAERSDGP